MEQTVQLKIWKFDEPISYYEILQAMPPKNTWISRAGVAEKITRSKSPTLIMKLTDLVVDGFLDINAVRLPNGVDMFVYTITERGMDAIFHGAMPLSFERGK